MNPIFKKLHLSGKSPALVLNSPEDFLEMLSDVNVEVHDEILDYYNYVQVFVQDEEDANDLIAQGISALEAGGYFWLSFPKANSVNYETNLNEKLINNILESFDMEGVTQVSLNEDWIALRIRFANEEDDFLSDEKTTKRMSGLYD